MSPKTHKQRILHSHNENEDAVSTNASIDSKSPISEKPTLSDVPESVTVYRSSSCASLDHDHVEDSESDCRGFHASAAFSDLDQFYYYQSDEEGEHDDCNLDCFLWRISVTTPSQNNKVMSLPAEEENDAAALEIRQKAYDLLTRMGGQEETVDKAEWPMSPSATRTPTRHSKKKVATPVYSSYQSQAAGEASAPRGGTEAASSSSLPPPPPYARSSSTSTSASTASSVVQVFVHCVADACKVASEEILSSNSSRLQTGYQSVKTKVQDYAFPTSSQSSVGSTASYTDIPGGSDRSVTGTFHSVLVASTSTKGSFDRAYTNGSPYASRYQDHIGHQ